MVNNISIKNRYIAIVDKKQLLRDLWNSQFKRIHNPDLIVDATGSTRALLPEPKRRNTYYTVQFFAKIKDLEDNIYIYHPLKDFSYAWAFPLGNGFWHVGAGAKSIEKAKYLLLKLKEFYKISFSNTHCKCTAKVNMSILLESLPFKHRNIVGVGESIGAISPLGEGNLPALQSAYILYKYIENNKLEIYEREIINKLNWIYYELSILKGIISRENKVTLLLKLLKCLIRDPHSIIHNF